MGLNRVRYDAQNRSKLSISNRLHKYHYVVGSIGLFFSAVDVQTQFERP
jgi:hypothetical protein